MDNEPLYFENNEPVYHDGRPYVIIRVDSSEEWAELYPGDNARGVKIKNSDRGFWVATASLAKRQPGAASLEEQVLGEIWQQFREDNWGGAMAALTGYGRDRERGRTA